MDVLVVGAVVTVVCLIVFWAIVFRSLRSGTYQKRYYR